MKKALSFLLGGPGDWHLRLPWLRLPSIGSHWFGPFVLVATVVGSWFAFSGTNGLDLASAFSMWIGASSILLMAWSFILALRISALERIWGGLDSMYRGHRWAGALAIPFMYLHTAIEPETKGADVIAGASKNVADTAEDLAGTGQTIIYVLIGFTLFRLIPYRWWRWTHKLFGIPFAFASWHFYTAKKPFDNASTWGWFFAAFMLIGLVAWSLRVFVKDTAGRGTKHTITAAETSGSMTRITLAPKSKPLQYEAGQFAFIRINVPGMREPHPFTIASPPSAGELEFFIRHLGDWSDRLADADLVGATVEVEGPYGEFEPFSPSHPKTLWIAGGVGITPFLAALREPQSRDRETPTLLYASRETEGDPIVEFLRQAHESGQIHLELFSSGNRLSPTALDTHATPDLEHTHVALCGPASLVQSMAKAVSNRGATSIETEDFDLRQGFGPDRSREIDRAIRGVVNSRR